MTLIASESNPHRRRRYPRFSVRVLIVLVLLVGAWLGWIVRSARIQREAVAAIRRAGGSLAYEWEWDLHHANTLCPPRWLVDSIGADYLGRVTLVTFYKSTNDAVFVQVGRLNKVQWLNLNGSTISDTGLAHVVGLNDLSVLEVADARVSDAGLAHLKGMTKLEGLNLKSVQVTDAGLVYVAGLSKLSWLDLCGTHVTDHGLAHLKTLTNLSTLHVVQGTQVTDAGIEELQRSLPNLSIQSGGSRHPFFHRGRNADE